MCVTEMAEIATTPAEPLSNTLAPLPPDWNLVRERYLNGDELADIAQSCGTTESAIWNRAFHEGWRDAELIAQVQDPIALSKELRDCVLVSVLKEARQVASERPRRNPGERITMAKARESLVAVAARLLGWSDDPAANAKQARCIDV